MEKTKKQGLNIFGRKDIPIFFCVDDGYIPYLGVVLESLRDHASDRYNYVVRVLYANNISLENRDKIINEYTQDNISIEFVDISDALSKICDKLHTRDYYSKTTYFRLFIPNLFPNLNKALYLDSDIVLLDDVAKLYNTNLWDNYVGAIPDESVGMVKEFQMYVENRLGLSSYKKYFNAGILLMNLKKLREINFEDLFISIIDKVTFNVAQDQDYLNTICKDRVQYISTVWNKMPLDRNGIKDEDVKLIHYNLSYKPWKLDNILYEEYFWKYTDMSIFKDIIHNYKDNYDVNLQVAASKQTMNLISMCVEQANDVDTNNWIQSTIDELKNDYCGELNLYGKVTVEA